MPDRPTETRTYQWRQTIIFKSCQHDDSMREVKPSQTLNVDQVLVLYDRNNKILRYAMSNKVGDVNGEDQEALLFLCFALSFLPSCTSCLPNRHSGKSWGCFCETEYCRIFSGGGPEENPCFTGGHGCDNNAICRPGQGAQFTCECAVGFVGDGRRCDGKTLSLDICLHV